LIADRERKAEDLIRCDKAKQRQLATTAFAMGLSLRQMSGRASDQVYCPEVGRKPWSRLWRYRRTSIACAIARTANSAGR
jgi:hypothetical protein